MKHKLFFLILLTCFIINVSDLVYSQEDGWDVFSTKFCTVFYKKGIDLKRVERRINLRFSDFYNPRNFRRNPELTVEDILGGKLDAIFMRVEDILDMYPSRIHVTINIYKNKEELNTAYEEIFNVPNKVDSFYVYKTNTIYTTQSVVHEGILAHEIAHCIIDHYFVILPPRKIQEMLAVYADIHLKD